MVALSRKDRRGRWALIEARASGSMNLRHVLEEIGQQAIDLTLEERARIEARIEANQLQYIKNTALTIEEALSSAFRFNLSKESRQNLIRYYEDKRYCASRAYRAFLSDMPLEFCTTLERLSQEGKIAALLFRAQYASSRAKRFTGRHSRSRAYDNKGEYLEKLCQVLLDNSCGLVWGWGTDCAPNMPSDVLYVDLPQGQISFHSLDRFEGPDYLSRWDGLDVSERRILLFCEQIWDSGHV